MYKSAEYVRGIYKEAGYTHADEEDFHDAQRSLEWVFDSATSKKDLENQVYQRLIEDPKHPRELKGTRTAMGLLGGAAGGLLGGGVAVAGGLLGLRGSRYAVPAGVLTGGALGALTGHQMARSAHGPKGEAQFQEALATQKRRLSDPKKMRSIAAEVAEEGWRWR